MSSRPRQAGRGRTEQRELVYGVHPVQALLDRRPREVERVFLAVGRERGAGRILRAAREAGVPVTRLPKDLLAGKIGARAAHQGIAARVTPVPYADVEELCNAAQARPDGLLVLLDRVEDAGNLGAILRTCAAAGADGVILGAEGSAGLSPVVAKTSAGAVERVPVARAARPARLLERLRRTGFVTLALDPRGELAWDRANLAGPTVLVVGGEGRGIRPGLRRACDVLVAIPLARKMDSLNVAVAAGVVLFELVRQRRQAAGGLETSETR